jgi:hypothetical protein
MILYNLNFKKKLKQQLNSTQLNSNFKMQQDNSSIKTNTNTTDLQSTNANVCDLYTIPAKLSEIEKTSGIFFQNLKQFFRQNVYFNEIRKVLGQHVYNVNSKMTNQTVNIVPIGSTWDSNPLFIKTFPVDRDDVIALVTLLINNYKFPIVVRKSFTVYTLGDLDENFPVEEKNQLNSFVDNLNKLMDLIKSIDNLPKLPIKHQFAFANDICEINKKNYEENENVSIIFKLDSHESRKTKLEIDSIYSPNFNDAMLKCETIMSNVGCDSQRCYGLFMNCENVSHLPFNCIDPLTGKSVWFITTAHRTMHSPKYGIDLCVTCMQKSTHDIDEMTIQQNTLTGISRDQLSDLNFFFDKHGINPARNIFKIDAPTIKKDNMVVSEIIPNNVVQFTNQTLTGLIKKEHIAMAMLLINKHKLKIPRRLVVHIITNYC